MALRWSWLALLSVVAACRSGAPAIQPLRVFAASSLTEAFEDLKKTFEASHTGQQVELTFGGSQVLRTQIEQGASADVFASADESHLQALSAAALVSAPALFARNDLVIIVPANNPAQIATLADLPRASKIVLAAPKVPVGVYARKLLKRAAQNFGPNFEHDVLSRVVSEESNVRLVRAKVALGEVDAAIVYRTDAKASEQVKSIEIAAEINQVAGYYVGSLTASKVPEWSEQWITLLQSPQGQTTLQARGFIGLER